MSIFLLHFKLQIFNKSVFKTAYIGSIVNRNSIFRDTGKLEQMDDHDLNKNRDTQIYIIYVLTPWFSTETGTDFAEFLNVIALQCSKIEILLLQKCWNLHL